MLHEILSTRIPTELKQEIEDFAILHDIDNSALLRIMCLKFSDKSLVITENDIKQEKIRVTEVVSKSYRCRRKSQRAKKQTA